MKVLNWKGFAHGQFGRCIVALPYGLGGVLWKNEIRGFWDVRVEKAYKYPQMNTMKFLVHESFEFGGVCTWLGCQCTTHSLIAWWGVLWKNEIRGFWDVRVGKAYKYPQMKTIKFLENESFEFIGFCTGPRLAVHHDITRGLGGVFCEKMKFVVFEMWGLERPKNVPKWRPLSSWCTKVFSLEGFAHGKLVGAPRLNLIGWWGVLWKNEICGFWDVRVGKA